jgi:hypothetical protein
MAAAGLSSSAAAAAIERNVRKWLCGAWREAATLDEITGILCGGAADPGQCLRDVAALQRPMICPMVWGDNYFFYRCRNCQTNPSSSLCVECFKAGDHAGHEYFLEESHYGGCCGESLRVHRLVYTRVNHSILRSLTHSPWQKKTAEMKRHGSGAGFVRIMGAKPQGTRSRYCQSTCAWLHQ